MGHEGKHLTDVDVAEASGWKTVETLETAYQLAYPETILRVVLEPAQFSAVYRSAVRFGFNSLTLLRTPLGAMGWRSRNPHAVAGTSKNLRP